MTDGCIPHAGLHLLPFPQAVIKGVVARGGIMTLSTPIKGTEILREALRWASEQWDYIAHAVTVLGVIERETVVRPEGEFTPVSLRERDMIANLLDEAAYAWHQESYGEHGNPRRPEWCAQVIDHVPFYVTCAYRQGWTS